MATSTTLNLVARSKLGKGNTRKLRATGKVPCILYGKGVETKSLAVDNRELLQAVAGQAVSNLVIDLNLSGDSAKALIRDIQLDPVSHAVLHVDFLRVSLTEMIEVEIPLELVGMPAGVREEGGILSHPGRTVTVKCLPGDIPEKIEVDVSELGLGASLHVSDLARIPGIEIVSEADTLVASVSAPSVQLEAAPTAEEVAEAEEAAEAAAAAEGAEGAEGDAAAKEKTKEGEDK